MGRLGQLENREEKEFNLQVKKSELQSLLEQAHSEKRWMIKFPLEVIKKIRTAEYRVVEIIESNVWISISTVHLREVLGSYEIWGMCSAGHEAFSELLASRQVEISERNGVTVEDAFAGKILE